MEASGRESITIVIATKGRLEDLKRLFESLQRLDDWREIKPQIIVGNNAAHGLQADRVDEMAADLARVMGDVVHMREESAAQPRPKCETHNRAIRLARGSVIAFIDDDVEVTPGWLKVTREFFLKHRFDAMQGAILIPPVAQGDWEFLKAWNRYRTIPYIDYGDRVREIKTLTGPNMAIRREVFHRVGYFDERLGPGRSGMSEDVEFSRRLSKGGGRIGYEPRAVAYHAADWSRFTEEYFRSRHEQQGRSRLIYKNSSMAAILVNLGRSILTLGWYSLFYNERKRYRSLGRTYHYRAMLKQRLGVGASE